MTNLFGTKTFKSVLKETRTKEMKELMIRALQCSIRSNKDVISLDIIYHAKQHYFTLKITNNELETLIKNRLYTVIEKLLEANTLLSN